MYFDPLKVLTTLRALLFLGGLLKFIYELIVGNLSETALLGVFGAAALRSLGLLSDPLSELDVRSDAI